MKKTEKIILKKIIPNLQCIWYFI